MTAATPVKWSTMLNDPWGYMDMPGFPEMHTKFSVGHCLDALRDIDDESVHMVLTDPPCFLNGANDRSTGNDNGRSTDGAVDELPRQTNPRQNHGLEFQKFIAPVAEHLLRVIVPGGFLLMFSSPVLYHRAAVAVEDAGFEIRDQYAWRYIMRSQFKATTLNHLVDRRDDISSDEKASIITELDGRRTAQLRPNFESILCAQKPRNGTLVDNWMRHGTGLIDPRQTLEGKAPATVMNFEKERHRNSYDNHLTPKPVQLCEHLIRLFTRENQTIIDPFVGSGTTCVAAKLAGRNSIGIDVNPDCVAVARKRVSETQAFGVKG